MKRFIILLFCLQALDAQTKIEPDAAGCVDSKNFPKPLTCRIDNCEQKESDHREVPVREDATGQPVLATLDGESRSVMYECAAAMTPAAIVQHAAAALRAAHFQVPYQFAEKEGTVTANKGDLWVLVEAAARYYTLTELKAAPPDFESITDAAGMSDAIERYGHMPVYGIKFPPGRAELAPESDGTLREIASMMEAHPLWRVKIESHTDNTGSKMGNMTLSQRRASAVASWLAGNGVKRLRLLTSGMGDSQPVADNTTEAGRAKNERIELVKLAVQPE